ncbi:MAG TPA: polysaccharide pyruvyl transferase family protein [Albitalea sp.]|uniref:polysaccharide pyruvyl transferase family protein n=1 Tax=Piscinibacter sp. TaxID=1903157 RepID=UPI002ED2B8D1
MNPQLKRRLKGYVRYAYLRRPRDYRQALERQRLQLRYVGWLGHRNIGDEVLFEAFRDTLFDDCLLVPYEDFSLLSAVASARRTTAVVLGGGTLINERLHLDPLDEAHREGRPFFVFGTGVSDPGYWAQYPKARWLDIESWKRRLATARYIGVRGPRSCEWLHAQGITQAEVIGDPALSIALPEPVPRSADAPLLGINLGAHDPVMGAPGSDFAAVLALIRHVVARGWRVRFLAMHPIDQRLGRRLKQEIADPAFELPAFDPDCRALLRAIASCDCVVGQRLHVTVLACAVAVPNLSLSYQPKCLDFLESIGREDLALKTDQLTPPLLIERLEWLQGADLSPQLRSRCDALRTLQRQRARQMVEALRT